MALPSSAYRAMTVQLDRVNEKAKETSAPARETIADLRAQIARLQSSLHDSRQENERLKALLGAGDVQSSLHHCGRAAMLLKDAAKRAGVSAAQASRYANSGWWQADKLDNGRWIVYADQPLTRKSRRGV